MVKISRLTGPRRSCSLSSLIMDFATTAITDDDDELVALGYVPSFKREFSNLATVCLVSLLRSLDLKTRNR